MKDTHLTPQDRALQDLGLAPKDVELPFGIKMSIEDAEESGLELDRMNFAPTKSAFEVFEEEVLEELAQQLPGLVRSESVGEDGARIVAKPEEIKAALREALADHLPADITVAEAVSRRLTQIRGNAVTIWQDAERRHEAWARTQLVPRI